MGGTGIDQSIPAVCLLAGQLAFYGRKLFTCLCLKGSEYRELIITNYDPEEKRRSSGQMTLFAPEFLGGGG